MANSKKDEPEIEYKPNFKGTENLKEWNKKKNMNSSHGTSGALYFVGFVGALVYWMQAAIGFGAVVTGILKALVWPAYIAYKLLESFYGVAV